MWAVRYFSTCEVLYWTPRTFAKNYR